MYSSGTTGVPKCITHGAGNVLIEHNKEFSELIWGKDYWEEQDKWKWWEYMYFLKKPQMIDIHWTNLPEIRSLYMQDGRDQNQPYRGFTNISGCISEIFLHPLHPAPQLTTE